MERINILFYIKSLYPSIKCTELEAVVVKDISRTMNGMEMPFYWRKIRKYQRGKSKNRHYTGQQQQTKRLKDKQWYTKHYIEIKRWTTRIPLKTGRVSSFTSGTRRATLVTNPCDKSWMRKIRDCSYHEWNIYMWSFVTNIFRNGWPSNVGDRKTFELMT